MNRPFAILLYFLFGMLLGCDRRSEWDEVKFTTEHVDRLVRDLALTPEQKQGALDLLAAYQLQHGQALAKIEAYRKVYESATKQGESEEQKAHIADTTARYERHCRDLRDSLIGDLRALISADQALAWPKFERWYRRGELLPKGTLHGESVDIERLVAALTPPVPIEGPLAEAFEHYSVSLDTALVSRQRALDERPPRPEDGLAPADVAAALERLIDDQHQQRLRVRNVNFDFALRIPPLLPEARREEFARAFDDAVYPEVFDRTAADAGFAEVLALTDLSPEQRTTLDEIRNEYESSLPEANRRWAQGIKRAEDRLSARTLLARVQQGGGRSTRG